MGSDTFPEPNTRQIIFLEPHAGPSIFYIDQISIILNRIQLKILQEENYTSAISLHKMIRFMCIKYIMNPLSQKFTISSFSTFLSYIFSESIFLKYHCIFSLYKVTDFTIKESSHPSKKIFYMYQLLVIWLTKHHSLLPLFFVTYLIRHHLLHITYQFSELSISNCYIP
jgi:hypothetical protein